MQDLSFEFTNAHLDVWGYDVSVNLYTFENAYGLDAEKLHIDRCESQITATCTGLLWAGGQEKASGWVKLEAKPSRNGVKIRLQAGGMAHVIRSAKVTLHNLRPGCIMNKLDLTRPQITPEGLLLKYPEGWRTIDTPMVIIGHEKGMTCLRSLDTRVRDKRFAFFRKGDWVLGELIFESYGSEITNEIDVPAWEIAPCDSVEQAYEWQKEHIERSFCLTPWEQREDVPAWARQIALVTAIHCQHWTGYIFNDYKTVLENLKWFAKRMEPKHILAFLPGWEGRYYWKYGNYCPDERLGGSAGYHYLCDGAREMGVHLMPMYGINCANRNQPGFEHWGEPSRATNPASAQRGGGVDWDGSRHYQHGYGAMLNPSAPQWRNHLTRQIIRLSEEYGLQAAFLDIAACWYNDPHFKPTNEGVKELCDQLRAGVPDMLVSGEAWYDGLTPAMPVIHSGHSDGPMNYHDAVYPPFFDTWMREFAHLCLGDPSRGSTGVHELGTNFAQWRTPLRKGVWPTVTVVDHTLERAQDKVEQIIADARAYAKQFL